MSRRKRATGLLAAAIATAALAIPVVASADHPGQTVRLKTTITTDRFATSGKVSSSNANCVESRQIIIKEKGFGKIGAVTTSSTGSWTAEPRYKGKLPIKVWAEVKPATQGTAGTIYKCLGATSKIRTISGG